MVMARTVKETARYWLRRLNVLLGFARVDPWTLSNGALEKLLDQMFFALEGNPGPVARELLRQRFDRIATREALREAHGEIKDALEGLFVKPPQLGFRTATLELTGQKHQIMVPRDGGTFIFSSQSNHFPSQVYDAFYKVLEASGVKPDDFLHCSYCGNLFVPLRKPGKGTPVYCSPKCANVIASRDYRARQVKMRRSGKKPKK